MLIQVFVTYMKGQRYINSHTERIRSLFTVQPFDLLLLLEGEPEMNKCLFNGFGHANFERKVFKNKSISVHLDNRQKISVPMTSLQSQMDDFTT